MDPVQGEQGKMSGPRALGEWREQRTNMRSSFPPRMLPPVPNFRELCIQPPSLGSWGNKEKLHKTLRTRLPCILNRPDVWAGPRLRAASQQRTLQALRRPGPAHLTTCTGPRLLTPHSKCLLLWERPQCGFTEVWVPQNQCSAENFTIIQLAPTVC